MSTTGNQDEDQKLALLVQQLRAKLKDDGKCANRAHIEEDEFLSMFLRIKAFDLEKAFAAVLKYYAHFEAFPQVLKDMRPSSHYKDLYDSNVFLVLRQTCDSSSSSSTGSTVCVYRNEVWNPSFPNRGLVPVRQSTMYILQESARLPKVQRDSLTFVFDYGGFSYAQLRQVGTADLRFLVQMWQDGFPLRVAGVHVINYPSMLLGLYYIACGFMKEKLRNRIHFHKDMASLHTKLGIGKEQLPGMLGGTRALEDVVDRSIEQRLVRDDLNYADYYK